MAAPAAAPGGMKLGSLAALPLPAKIAICVLVPALFGVLYFVIFYNELTTKIDQATRQQANLRSDLSTQQQAQASYLADRDEQGKTPRRSKLD